MAFNVITPSNSRTVQLADFDVGAYLLVTEGGYITESLYGYPAYFANAGSANVTIKGTVISGSGFGGLYLGVQDSFTSGGGNQVTVSASGLVEGNNAMTLFGGNNSVVNAGLLRGTGRSDPGGIDTNKPGGVVMYGDGNTVTNSGTIAGYYGIFSRGQNAVVNNSGTISTTNSDAIQARDGTITINNSGTIIGGVTASGDATNIYNSGVIQGRVFVSNAFVVNYGTITGSCVGNSGDDAFRNYGTIASIQTIDGQDTVFNGAGGIIGSVSFGGLQTPDLLSDDFTNDGQVGSVRFDAGSDAFTNTGLVTGTVTMGDGSNNLDNTGVIVDAVYQGSGTDGVTNFGSIGSVLTGAGADLVVNTSGATIRVRVYLDDSLHADADTLLNDGTIGVDLASFGLPTILFGDGADIFQNTGIVYGRVDLGAAADIDTLTNSGTITGGVTAGGGDDVIDSSLGVIGGVVDLGDGTDSYLGGDGIDRVTGGLGADTIDLADGRDVYRAGDGDGNDDLDGGEGIDTYNASAVTTAFILNLGAATTGNAIGNDTIAGFENIVGGSAADNLSGDDGANRIDGQDGADVIFGDDGKDRLIGGLGTDTITGGAGRDILTGGKAGSQESDRFVFADGDSGTTASTRDVITDFRDHRSNVPAMFLSNPDQINLSAIDANTGVAGDQVFSFNQTGGAAFSGAAGSLIWQQFTGFALISGDVNGDGKADFVIQLNGSHGLFTSDFLL